MEKNYLLTTNRSATKSVSSGSWGLIQTQARAGTEPERWIDHKKFCEFLLPFNGIKISDALAWSGFLTTGAVDFSEDKGNKMVFCLNIPDNYLSANNSAYKNIQDSNGLTDSMNSPVGLS